MNLCKLWIAIRLLGRHASIGVVDPTVESRGEGSMGAMTGVTQ